MSSFTSWLPTAHPKPSAQPNPLDALPTPPPLPQPTRLLLALSTLCAASGTSNPNFSALTPGTQAWVVKAGKEWQKGVCKMIEFESSRLPPTVGETSVQASAKDHWEGMGEKEKTEEYRKIVETLVMASIFTPPTTSEEVKKVDIPTEVLKDHPTPASSNPEKPTAAPAKTTEVPTLSYTPLARSLIHTTLSLLSIPVSPYLAAAESGLSVKLFSVLQQVSAKASQEEVENARKASSEGWGGATGRKIATGLGVVAGGLAIGITGGLAAPAIAALIPGFLTFGLLTTATAPVVLGGVFGLTAGGLTGKRVKERWRGVEEFEFIDVKVGTAPITEASGVTYEVRKRRVSGEPRKSGEEERKSVETEEGRKSLEMTKATETLSLDEKPPISPVTASEPSVPTTPVSPTIQKDEEKKLLSGRPPSLIATIVVPGLLATSELEALQSYQTTVVPHTFSDGRDVFVLKYSTKEMLSTGKAVDGWVTGKLKGQVKKQIIKRTALSAYFAAVSLPMSVYGLATMGLDNTWMQSQDKARKAGRLLGEVLEKRVQGQRPVVLIGSSLGALTILHALLYLSSLPSPSNLPQIVESAFLISLPSAPSPTEWAACRGVVARRFVNAWCGSDFVLAGVVRLHEVISRAATLENGIKVAGLAPVERPGVEDVDISGVVDGHMALQGKMNEILEVIQVDS